MPIAPLDVHVYTGDPAVQPPDAHGLHLEMGIFFEPLNLPVDQIRHPFPLFAYADFHYLPFPGFIGFCPGFTGFLPGCPGFGFCPGFTGFIGLAAMISTSSLINFLPSLNA